MTSQKPPAAATKFISSAARLCVAAGVSLAGLPAFANSANHLTGAQILTKINAALLAHGVDGTAKINAKDRHNPCPGDISVAPLFNSWKTLKVTCPSNPGWRLLVRVSIGQAKPMNTGKNTVQIETSKKQHTTAFALRRSMVKGELIQRNDIISVPIKAQQSYGVFFNRNDLIGRRVRTPITAREPVKSRQLDPRFLVETNKPVTIALETNGILVEMAGISLQDGQAGELVKVENLSSGKTIIGKVIDSRKISPLY